MKIKAILTIDIAQFENIKPEIEIDVPDDLKNEELVAYLWNKYHKMCDPVINPKKPSRVSIHADSEEIQ